MMGAVPKGPHDLSRLDLVIVFTAFVGGIVVFIGYTVSLIMEWIG